MAERSQRQSQSRSSRGTAPARPSQTLPTERIAFGKQMDILRAFGIKHGQTGEPVTNAEVADIADMSPYSVGLTNPFFVDVVFLDRTEGGFVPAREVLTFTRSHQWNPATAPRELAPLLGATWFADALVPRLQFGSTLTETEALRHLAVAAGAETKFKPNLGLLLDYLDAAALIVKDGERIGSPRHAGKPSGTHEVDGPGEQPDVEADVPETSTTVTRTRPAEALHHPLIQGMIQELPPPRSPWTAQELDEWLELAKVNLRVVYRISQSSEPKEPEPDL